MTQILKDHRHIPDVIFGILNTGILAYIKHLELEFNQILIYKKNIPLHKNTFHFHIISCHLFTFQMNKIEEAPKSIKARRQTYPTNPLQTVTGRQRDYTYLKCHDNSDCLLRVSSLKHTPHSHCAGMQGDLYERETRTGGRVGRGIRGANLRPQRDRDTLQPVNSNRERHQDSCPPAHTHTVAKPKPPEGQGRGYFRAWEAPLLETGAGLKHAL